MSRRFLAVVCAILVAAAWLGGCSDSPRRQAGGNLRQKVADAQHDVEKALALMGNPAYGDAGGRPFSAEGFFQEDPNLVAILPPEALDPRAMDFLNAGPLEQAIQDNAQAHGAEKSLALGQAGRIHELRGVYFSWQAGNARRRLQDLLAEARRLEAVLQVHAGSLKYFQAFLSGGASDANALVASARKQADEAAVKLQATNAEIQTLQDKANGLRQSVERLSKEAGDLRQEGKASSGKKALELSGKYIEKQSQANQASSELSAVENTVLLRKADQMALAEDANLAQAMVAIGTGALQSHQELVGAIRRKLAEIAGAIAQTQEKLDELAGRMSQLAKEVRDAEEKASGAFSLAGQRFQAAQVERGAEAGAAEAGKRAEVSIAQARLLGASLRLRASLAAFADQVKAIWPLLARPNEMPEAYAKLASDYLPDPNSAQSAAQKTCLEAVDFYRKMASAAEPKLKWVYQALVGTSYLCLYELSQDRTDLTQADGALSEAVKDKEDSPYLADVVEIHRQVQALLKAAPAPAPAR